MSFPQKIETINALGDRPKIRAGRIQANLDTATLYLAEYFKMSDRAGIIKAGYKADLVIVESNPLESIEALRDISLVLTQSRVYSRKDFSTIRSDVKKSLSKKDGVTNLQLDR